MNREQDDIDKTIEFCHNKIKNENLSLIEKKTLLFYAKKLQDLRGCPDNQKFVKPGKCIGGYGDQMVFKPWVMRDVENNPLINGKDELVIKSCGFQDMHTYLQYVRGERKVQRKCVEFYNGMPQDEYINWQRMKISSHCY